MPTVAIPDTFNEVAVDLNKQGIFVGYSGCPPLLGIYSLRPNRHLKDCKKLNEKIFKYASSNKIKKIHCKAFQRPADELLKLTRSG